MSSGLSNDNGRALEFFLTKAIIESYPSVIVGNYTAESQIRDLDKIDSLPYEQQKYFSNNINYLVRKILPEMIANKDISEVIRFGDASGVSGDVTDIRLNLSDGSDYNISLKHNHRATKHQRPGALMKQLGVKDTIAIAAYKEHIKNIESDFYSKVCNNNNTFREVKYSNPEYIYSLYKDICDLVINRINKYSDFAPDYFKFLIGINDFDKIVITKQNIEIYKFYNLPIPSCMTAKMYESSYIDLEFNNGFSFRMRIHNASSKFDKTKAISLKFDTHLRSENIPCLKYAMDNN